MIKSLSKCVTLFRLSGVWLQYKNVRPDYVKNIWKIINWKDVAARFDDARKA